MDEALRSEGQEGRAGRWPGGMALVSLHPPSLLTGLKPSRVVLVLGLLGASLAFVLAWRVAQGRATARFEVGVTESSRRLEERLRACDDLLRGLQGFGGATGLPDRQQYGIYLASLDVQARFPGLLGVTYGVPVPEADRSRLEAWLRRAYPERNVRVHPSWGEGEACIAILGEPQALNAQAMGFNSFSSPSQRSSLEQARDSGELVASPPMRVAQAPEGGPGLILRLAVYRPGMPLDSVEARRRAFIGYGNAVFLLADLAGGASSRAALDGLRMQVADMTDPRAPVVFLRGGQVRTPAWWHRFGPGPKVGTRSLSIGTRRWELRFEAGGGFHQAWEVALPWLTLGGASAITLLLAALLESVSRTGERARLLAGRMTQALRHSESRLRAITQVLPDVIFVLNADGRYEEIHTGDPSRLVAPEALLLGRNVREFLPTEVADQVVKTIRQAISTGHVQPCEYALETQRGPLRFEARVAPMPAGPDDTPTVIWVARDVTEQRVQEQASRQAQRLESLGMLAGGIAHDFNNLLSAIQGFLSLQRMDLEQGRDPSRHLDRMETSIQRAADLARQLLAYSGRGQAKVEPMDLNALVGEMSELLAVSRSRKVTVEVLLAPLLPGVLGDHAQLQQVVMNLVTNAAEAMGEGTGRVWIRTGTEVLDALALAARMPGQDLHPGLYVTLEVEDEGSGMPPEVMARIFDPFFTTKATGRGLGLSAIRGILRAHRAGIAIDTAQGQGTRFRIYFPAHGGPTSVSLTEAATPEGLVLSGPILLAEDEPVLRDTTAGMLEQLGFQVKAVGDGVEAWAALQEPDHSYAAVMLDLTMPRLGGLEVYRRLRDRDAALPILLVSGYSREEVPELAGAAEPTVFLQKPFGFEQLREALGTLARRLGAKDA